MSLTHRLVAVIDEAIDDGAADLVAACETALAWLKREHLGEELLAEQGVRLLSDLYRNCKPMGADSDAAATWTTPGGAKASADAVNRGLAIFREYESVVNKRFGDCTVADLKILVAHRHGLAEANARAAQGYLAVLKEVQRKKVPTVFDAFKDAPDRLRELRLGGRHAS
jgi:hypothetical protein